jgi:hypothetical protein
VDPEAQHRPRQHRPRPVRLVLATVLSRCVGLSPDPPEEIVKERLCNARMNALRWELRATMLLLVVNILFNIPQFIKLVHG